MSTLTVRIPDEHEQPGIYMTDGPVDFAEWLQIAQEFDSELIRGVVVERMVAYYPHESIFAWLHAVLYGFVTNRRLGKVLGSRSAVKITSHDGRLPDILFVSADNDSILHDDAIYGSPDVVIEIVSKNDCPRYLLHLETDYQSVGVNEIVFIDPRKKQVKCIHKTENGYASQILTEGLLRFTTIPGFEIEVEWIFGIDRPDPYTVLKRLIE
jgi:Uma2 family endonuclease